MKRIKNFKIFENSESTYGDIITSDTIWIGYDIKADSENIDLIKSKKISKYSKKLKLDDDYSYMVDNYIGLILVFKGNNCLYAIFEYELSNPFTFDDIIVCPGHDDITVFNYKTGKNKKSHIR